MAMRWEQLAKHQPVAAKMLQSGLEKGRISHAYLFEGQRGTGKKPLACCWQKACFACPRQESPRVWNAATAGASIPATIRTFG